MSERAGGAAPSWYRSWFGEEYLELYPHRDADEAERAVALVVRTCTPVPGARALDVGCGAGRHLAELRQRGVAAVGLDLSSALLERAAAAGNPVVRGDMRHLPFAGGSLDLVTSFFTSFGYFDHPDEDAQVVREFARVLRAGGHVALDYLNADRVRRTLRPRDERSTRGRSVVETRALVEGGRVVEKRIEIRSRTGAERVFLERVRLYETEELLALFRQSGVEPVTTFGDYDGSPAGVDAPRLIVIGMRT